MAKPTVADYLLERLRAWGVDKVFAFPGDGINGILAAWGRAEDNPKFVQSRHEEMSAFEAVGYSKFTGRLGVCMATSGPGAIDRKSTRLNSSHSGISYAAFCLKNTDPNAAPAGAWHDATRSALRTLAGGEGTSQDSSYRKRCDDGIGFRLGHFQNSFLNDPAPPEI